MDVLGVFPFGAVGRDGLSACLGRGEEAGVRFGDGFCGKRSGTEGRKDGVGVFGWEEGRFDRGIVAWSAVSTRGLGMDEAVGDSSRRLSRSACEEIA